MIHRFHFEVEGVRMPFQAFSIMVGERVGEAVVSVPPLSAFFHLPPGTYARLVFLDDVLKKEVTLFDGVLVGAGLAKSATGMTVDLRFVDPLRFIFPFPLAVFSYNITAEGSRHYDSLAQFLLQRLNVSGDKKETALLTELLELSEMLNSSVTVGRYVKKLMSVVLGASGYTSRIAAKFNANNRYKVLARDLSVNDFLRSRRIFEYLLKYTGSYGLTTVGEYFEKFLDAVGQRWYYQGVFLGEANVLVVPSRLYNVPPKPNVFAPCAIVTLDLSVDYTTPTRVLVTMEAGDLLLYEPFPSSSLTATEELRGVWPDFLSVPVEEFLASSNIQNQNNTDVLKGVANFFARRHLYNRYLSANTANLKTPFYPYALVGLPAIILTPTGHYAGVLIAARHEYSVEGNAASFFTLAGVVPASILDKTIPQPFAKLYSAIGTEAVEGRNIREAARREYQKYEESVGRKGRSDEAQFWWWYTEHAVLKTGHPTPPASDKYSGLRRKIAEDIRNFLSQYPIVTLRNAEKLENQTRTHLGANEKAAHSIHLWLEGY